MGVRGRRSPGVNFLHRELAPVSDQEDVAWCGHGMVPAPDLAKRMQALWAWRAKKAVPGIGAKRHDTGQSAIEVAKAHRTQEAAQIATKASYSGTRFRTGIHCSDQKNRSTREMSNNWLRNSRWHALPLTG